MKLFLRTIALYLILPFTLFAHDNLSICAIFQNEGPFLQEWIEFHKLQGVQHFYLYNNNSKDSYKRVLKPYIESKEVTLVDWLYTFEPGATEKWLAIQRGAYKDCLAKFGQSSSWIAFIDIDEFLFCPTGETLPAFLNRYKSYGGVCANWLLFGTSHVEKVPNNRLMIEVLTYCSLPNNPRNIRIKSIVQPKYVVDCDSAHSFLYKEGYFAVGPDEDAIIGGNSNHISHDKLRINHYWTRTEKCFRERKIKSRQNRRKQETADSYLQDWADSYNLSINEDILQFVPALREQMGLPEVVW